jgi:hypothetical protein
VSLLIQRNVANLFIITKTFFLQNELLTPLGPCVIASIRLRGKLAERYKCDKSLNKQRNLVKSKIVLYLGP